MTDAALGYFSPKQSHNLSILRLQSCWELTNHGIVNIGMFMNQKLFFFSMQYQESVNGIFFHEINFFHFHCNNNILLKNNEEKCYY